jgi:hypothetical protein
MPKKSLPTPPPRVADRLKRFLIMKLYHTQAKVNNNIDFCEKNNIKTWLYFFLWGAQGDIFLEYNLPTPNYVINAERGVFIGWQINGYPGTAKSREYFNDIIARFLIAYKAHKPERLPYRPDVSREAIKLLDVSYELKEFQNLPSLYWANKKKIWTAESVGTIDQIFWAIKLYVEELIREFGEGVGVPYGYLEDFAFKNFFDRKDKSTLRAKCRAIWNWYDERGWIIPKRREWKMTRSERAKTNAQLKKQRARAVLLGFIKGSLLANEYKKKDGSWNITKLSMATGLSRPTIISHLKEMRKEGIID